MSRERWLRWYPPAWRERYGDELADLVAAMSADRGTRSRGLLLLDIARGGTRERLRGWLGGGDPSPGGRVRAGVLLVLCGWAVFLVGGAVFQRFSENWRQVTPASARGLPGAAYDTLIAAAVVAALLVIAGILWALPHVVSFLRSRDLRPLADTVAAAVTATIVAVVLFVVVLIWSHSLASAQRNGGDTGYEAAFVVFGLAAAVALAIWTALAVRLARLVELPASVLRVEKLLAVGVGACMGLMLIAVAVWWGALAHSAPWALHDDPTGTAAPLVSVQLLIAGILMAAATVVGGAGAVRAVRADRQLPG